MGCIYIIIPSDYSQISDTFLIVITNFRRRWIRLSLQLGFESFNAYFLIVLVGEVHALLKVIYWENGPMCIEEFIFKEREELRFLFRDTTLLPMLATMTCLFYTIILHKKQSERGHVKGNFRNVMAHYTLRLEENISQWLAVIVN